MIKYIQAIGEIMLEISKDLDNPTFKSVMATDGSAEYQTLNYQNPEVRRELARQALAIGGEAGRLQLALLRISEQV